MYTNSNVSTTTLIANTPYALWLCTGKVNAQAQSELSACTVLWAGGVLPYLPLCKDSCPWRHSHRAGWGEAELKHHSCTSCLLGPVVDEVGPSGCCAVDRCCPKMDNIVCETEWWLYSPPLARNGVLPTRGTSLQLRST